MGLYSAGAGLGVMMLCVGASWVILRVLPGLDEAIGRELANPRFVPQLEGLRGLLALAVVVHHGVVRFIVLPRAGAWGEPPSKFFGQMGSVPVLMFFFLTGFLFWTKLLRKPELRWRGYLVARVRRLVPVYLFAMAWFFLLVGVVAHFRLSGGVAELVESGLAWLTFTVAGQPDVDGVKNASTLIAGTPWTLAFEWQFYLLLPLLGWFARRGRRVGYVLAVSAGLFVLTNHKVMALTHLARKAWLQPLADGVHLRAGHMFFSFGVGMAVAVLRSRWRPGWAWLRSGWASAGCVVVVGCVMLLRSPRLLTPVESMSLGLVFLALVYGNTLWGLLRWRPVLLLGKCSYSLYLCHGLVLATLGMGVGRSRSSMEFPAGWSWGLIALGAVLAVVVAVGSYEWIEARWMTRPERLRVGAVNVSGEVG